MLLPLPLTPVTQTSRASGSATSSFAQVVARDAFELEPSRVDLRPCVSLRRGCERMLRRRREHATRDRALVGHQIAQRAVDDDLAAVAARAGTEIDDVLGAANRLLVVLDDDDGVALRRELRDRIEQQRVVARVQADRRLVEDVADAAQIRAELRGEPDALRFAARQRRRRAVEREVAQADELEEARAG